MSNGDTWCAVWAFVKTIDVLDVATIASVIFVAWQTILLRKTYQYNCDWQEKEKATELSVMYKNEILPSVTYISKVLKATEIMEALGNIHTDNIDQFNQTELFRLTNQHIQELVEKKEKSFDSIDALLNARHQFGQISRKGLLYIDPALITLWYQAKRGEKDSTGATIVISDAEKEMLLKQLWFEYAVIVSNTLNSLEYFAMNFISGVADDEVVFQSLHQTYLNLVQLLYYNISLKNTHEKDKYYTNVIDLYKRWREKDKENERKINAAISKARPVRK